MYDMLVLGMMYPPDSEKQIIEKSKSSTLQFAANAHFKMLVHGVEGVLGNGVKILSILPVGSYPKRYTDSFINEFEFKFGKNSDCINVGYCNVTVLKQFSKPYALKKHALRWAGNNSGRKKVVLVYTVEPELLAAAQMLKRKCDCHICQIVTDLPDYTDIDKSGSITAKIATSYRVKTVADKVKCADSFVFLTRAMADYFKTDKPYIVMEGIVPSDGGETECEEVSEVKTVVYTGSLTKKYGVMDLVNAFRLIEGDDYRLIICGSGEAETDIRAVDDKRICFMGAVEHSKAQKLQRKATLLVNPRNAKEEFTKYSFPSKIMEYMMAARPIVCFKLDGIPDEYDKYLNYFENDSIEVMAENIKTLCRMFEGTLKTMGNNARNFVLENKNEYVQAKRMLDMIEKCLEEKRV